MYGMLIDKIVFQSPIPQALVNAAQQAMVYDICRKSTIVWGWWDKKKKVF